MSRRQEELHQLLFLGGRCTPPREGGECHQLSGVCEARERRILWEGRICQSVDRRVPVPGFVHHIRDPCDVHVGTDLVERTDRPFPHQRIARRALRVRGQAKPAKEVRSLVGGREERH
ncbi:MAG: hypothetical protein OXI96_03565 [Acidimicrobiaceae bacterium]|nr:hypothetical protein [Acidimicrobiaceae bacterium]